MSPLKLTKRREAIIERIWQVFSLGWVLVVTVLVFSGLFELLPGWAVAIVLLHGMLVMLLIGVEVYVDSSKLPASGSTAQPSSGSDGATR